MLSNNHVLANEDEARPGDAVLQPGPADGGADPADRIGTFERAVALSDSRPNLVDAAIAALAAGIEAEIADYGPLGTLSGVLEDPAEAGAVAKRGRTTAFTRGRVTAFELDGVQVGYTRGTLTFDDQIEIESTGSGSFSAGGDSGSLILTADDAPRAVGLLFAGSETGGPTGTGLTFANSIANVLRALGVTLAAGGSVAALEDARAAKAKLAEALEGDPAVNGIGVAPREDGYELKVNLREPSSPGRCPMRSPACRSARRWSGRSA